MLTNFSIWFYSNRQDPVAITSPGVKLLVYKDCKKNFQRVMKFHAEKKNSNSENTGSDPFVDMDRQFLKDNLNTMEVKKNGRNGSAKAPIN